MDFDVNGFFYTDNFGDDCRKYLNITRKSTTLISPQLMIVMMNPGSSVPIDETANNILTPTLYDPTQLQIMKIMDRKEIDFARIINLSDLRESKSSKFYSKIRNSRKDNQHSIFHESRMNDLASLYEKNVPVIFAWGVNPALDELTQLACNTLKVSNPLGILKNNNRYYHARPRIVSEQRKWLDCILKQK